MVVASTRSSMKPVLPAPGGVSETLIRPCAGGMSTKLALEVPDATVMTVSPGCSLPPAVSGFCKNNSLANVSGVQASRVLRSEEHTSELQSLMRISYAVFCLTQKTKQTNKQQL